MRTEQYTHRNPIDYASKVLLHRPSMEMQQIQKKKSRKKNSKTQVKDAYCQFPVDPQQPQTVDGAPQTKN